MRKTFFTSLAFAVAVAFGGSASAHSLDLVFDSATILESPAFDYGPVFNQLDTETFELDIIGDDLNFTSLAVDSSAFSDGLFTVIANLDLGADLNITGGGPAFRYSTVG